MVFYHGAFGDANAFWFLPCIQRVQPTPTVLPQISTPTPAASATPTPTATPTPAPSGTPALTPTPELSEYPVEILALNTLATDLGIAPVELKRVIVGAFEWPHTCLGLPEEGEICASQLNPGFWVVANHNAISYEIRAN
jgi:hypothetical protein